jgi:hypothetical protein
MAQSLHDLGGRALALADGDGIDTGIGEDEVVGHQRRVMAAHDDRKIGPALLDEARDLEGGVDVGREGAADADDGRDFVHGPVEGVPGVDAEVDQVGVMPSGSHGAADAFQPQRLARQDTRQAEARSLRGLNQ